MARLFYVYKFDYTFSKTAYVIIKIPKTVKKVVSYLQKRSLFFMVPKISQFSKAPALSFLFSGFS